MEEHETNTNPEPGFQPDLTISKEARSFWPGIQKWTLFLALICMAGAGFAIMYLVIMVTAAYKNTPGLPDGILVNGLLFLLLLAFGFLFLSVSNNTGRAVQSGHPDDVQQSTQSMLNYFRTAGIAAALGIIVQLWFLLQGS